MLFFFSIGCDLGMSFEVRLGLGEFFVMEVCLIGVLL